MGPGTFELQETKLLHDDMSGKYSAVCDVFVKESRS
jgi:hypothetical protein